jgi:hypothetical protein
VTGAKQAVLRTTEYWYLRWWSTVEPKYRYPYRETNHQTYVLVNTSDGWQVDENIRPAPRSSTPHRQQHGGTRRSSEGLSRVLVHNGCHVHSFFGKADMTTLELTLNLPDGLAKEAARMGLLDPDSLQALLREAVRNRRIAKLAEARKEISAAGIPPMTMEEIQAEIDADRTERRSKAAG